MIKLGAPDKDQVKVDALAGAINSSKLELEVASKEASVKQSELVNILNKIDFAAEELASRQSDNLKFIENKTSEIADLNNDISSLQSDKLTLEQRIRQFNDDLSSEQMNMLVQVKEYEKTASIKLRALNVEVAAMEVKKAQLTDFINVLSLDSIENSTTVEHLKSEVKVLESQLVSAQEEHDNLVASEQKVVERYTQLSAEIVSKRDETNKLTEMIASLSSQVVDMEKSKLSLQTEVDTLNSKKDNFNREKLAFQANKELILLREQYIVEKYNLAGVPYN